MLHDIYIVHLRLTLRVKSLQVTTLAAHWSILSLQSGFGSLVVQV